MRASAAVGCARSGVGGGDCLAAHMCPCPANNVQHCTDGIRRIDESLCNSPCMSRQNIIALHSPPSIGAGLEDRTNIITFLGAYAEALCSRLFVPRPCVFLGAHFADALDCKLGWSSYLDLSRASGILQEFMPPVRHARPKQATLRSLGLNASYELIEENFTQAVDSFHKSNLFFLSISMSTIWNHIRACSRMRIAFHGLGCKRFFKKQVFTGTRSRDTYKDQFAGIIDSDVALRAAKRMTRGLANFSVLHLRRNQNFPSLDYCILGHAGLGDRWYIYDQIGELAQRQGGRLYIAARPCLALDPKHNFGKRLSCELPWETFLSLPPHIRPHDGTKYIK